MITPSIPGIPATSLRLSRKGETKWQKSPLVEEFEGLIYAK
jgi:hypothetical protein